MRNVIVVGGAGFVGSHLVDFCLERGCQVLVFDDFSTGRREFLAEHPALQVEEGDILDTAHLAATVRSFKADTLYHLAAIHYIPACEEHPEKALRINVEGTQSVLTASGAYEDLSRIVFASTGALYDPENQGPLNEGATIRAHGIYGISKLAAEQLLKYHISKANTQVVAARLFNVVGRRETNPHMIPAISGQLSRGRHQITLGNLHPRRDYIHVEDVGEALFSMGHMRLHNGFDVFNVGSGVEHSVQEVVDLFAEVIGEPLEVISLPELQRKVDRPTQLADSSKLQNETGWHPSRELRQALSEIWEETIHEQA